MAAWALSAVLSTQAVPTNSTLTRHVAPHVVQTCIIGIRVDYFGHLPVSVKSNSTILRFTARFSRRAYMYAVSATLCLVEGPDDILVTGRPLL